MAKEKTEPKLEEQFVNLSKQAEELEQQVAAAVVRSGALVAEIAGESAAKRNELVTSYGEAQVQIVALSSAVLVLATNRDAAEVAVHDQRVLDANAAADDLKKQHFLKVEEVQAEVRRLNGVAGEAQRDATLDNPTRQKVIVDAARRAGELEGEVKFLLGAHQAAHKRAEGERVNLKAVKARQVEEDSPSTLPPLSPAEIDRWAAAGFLQNKMRPRP